MVLPKRDIEQIQLELSKGNIEKEKYEFMILRLTDTIRQIEEQQFEFLQLLKNQKSFNDIMTLIHEKTGTAFITNEENEEKPNSFEKVKVSKGVAEALEELMNDCKQNREEAADEYFEMRYHWEEHDSLSKIYMPLVEFGTDNFIKALYYGYEIME